MCVDDLSESRKRKSKEKNLIVTMRRITRGTHFVFMENTENRALI